MSAAARRDDATEAELRAQVLDLGEAVATLTRRQAVLERLLMATGTGALPPAGPGPVSPYDEAAAVQARRRSMHLAGGS